ncbi:hypothetical protein [Microcystis phage Mae-JY30]
MNHYRFSFHAVCPVDGARILYRAEIRTPDFIPAERLRAWASERGLEFHERLADALAAEFGGEQTILATHQGVEIETRRP